MRMAATIVLGISTGFSALMALLCLAGAIVTPLAIALDPAVQGDPDAPPAWLGLLFYGLLFLVQAVCVVVQGLGARALHQGRAGGAAWAGAVAALLGGAMCCNGWNLAAGIFLCVVLLSGQLEEAGVPPRAG